MIIVRPPALYSYYLHRLFSLFHTSQPSLVCVHGGTLSNVEVSTITTKIKKNKSLHYFSFNIIMSTDRNTLSLCANCGKGEEESTSLKKCGACRMVKYCSALPVKKHIVLNIKRNVGSVQLNCIMEHYLHSHANFRKIVQSAFYGCLHFIRERDFRDVVEKRYVVDATTPVLWWVMIICVPFAELLLLHHTTRLSIC